MRWQKLGPVFAPRGDVEWAQSRAYLPTPYAIDADRVRVYLAFLDRHQVGRVGFVDVAADDPTRVLAVSERPVLNVGRPGAFDDQGVTPSSVVAVGTELRLYYFGWQRGAGERFLLFGGLAASDDGGASFTRVSESPVLEPCDRERVCRSAPMVVRDGDRWHAWYVSGDEWVEVGGRTLPRYEIRTATSSDGVTWSQSATALSLSGEDEFGLGRPFVRRLREGYEMWYSIRRRSRGYRIGYATSADGRMWTRRDREAGLDVSSAGWDSEMVCFAAVQQTAYGTYLFYNGNGYGETGFGVAREVRE